MSRQSGRPRREVIERLAASLSDDEQGVPYPDHPLLLRSPDILGRERGELVAYFVDTEGGPSPRSRSEISRVMLSRLALPSSTRFVFIATGDARNKDRDLRMFDEVRVVSEGGDVENGFFLESGVRSAVEKVRDSHFERFAEAWRGTTEAERRERGARPEFSASESLQLPSWMRSENGVLHARLGDRATRAGSSSTVLSVISAATAMDYQLAYGLDGLRDRAQTIGRGLAGLPFHSMDEDRPRAMIRKNDNMKFYRAAAFAGIEPGAETAS